jgi:hypothetical protein
MFKSFTASDKKLPGNGKQPADEWAPPQSVRRAVRLMYAGAATMTVFFITALATMGGFKNAVITANKTAKHPMTTSQINGYVTGYTLYVIVIGIISIGLWLWMARMNGQGKNWARITATVLLCLWTVNTAGVVQTGVVQSMIFPVIAWLIGAAAIFYLWRQESGAFFGSKGAAGTGAGKGGSGPLPQLLPWRKDSADRKRS